MSKIILLAAIIGAVYSIPTAKISSTLSSTLESKENADIMVTFVGSNSKVIHAIETQTFKSRGERLNTLAGSLKATREASQQDVQKYLKNRNVQFKSFWISNEISIPGASKDIIQTLATFPEVEFIDQEQVITLESPISSKKVHQDQNPSWNLVQIQAPEAWAITNGTGVTVASIDSAVRATHEALRHNFRSDGYGWYDPYDHTNTSTGHYHGTFTMGAIVGGNGIGVAPGAGWINCRGCRGYYGTCTRSKLVACGEWILCPTLFNGTGEDCTKAPVVCSSSWNAQNATWYEAVTEAWIAGGIVPVFSIGNHGPNCNTVTDDAGSFKRVIGVGATDINNKIPVFSSIGPASDGRIKPDISAPGLDINSAWQGNDDEYRTFSSTAMAASQISGVVALAMSVNPNLTFEQVRQILVDGVDRNLTSSNAECGGIHDNVFPNNHFGSGRTNALKVVQGAQALLLEKPQF